MRTESKCLTFFASLLLWACATTIQAAIPASERQVLLDLFNCNNGAGWTNNAGWNGAAGTECWSWYGISCDGAQTHIISINLESNNLTGTLPSLGGLTGLESFYVSHNQLTGSIPSLSGLTALQDFEVQGNQLTGSIPSLSGLTELQDFEVNDNLLTGSIPSLSGLTVLQTFGVGNNQLTGTVPTAPNSLFATTSDLCGNSLASSGDSGNDAAWNTATGTDWLACQSGVVATVDPSTPLPVPPTTQGVCTGAAGELPTEASTVYGFGGYRPVFPSGPNDLTGVRYRFKVITNQSESLRLIFGSSRMHRPGSPITYPIESNIYSGRYVYSDGGCTTWPLLGQYIEAESSLRNAIPDYPYHLNQQEGITTGIRTSDGAAYPIQTYLIDNITNLYKSDAISQFSINGLETMVTIERGEVVDNVDSFARCGRALLPGTYRKWYVQTEMEGYAQVTQEFVAPEDSAAYLTVNEAMMFFSEYLNFPGEFTVHIWAQEYKRESDPVWRQVSNFITNSNYDGNGSDFGVRVVSVGDQYGVEFSNHAGNAYLPKDTQFSLPTTSPTGTTVAPSTPLPPPPATQTVFTVATGTMPTAAVSVDPSGTFGDATLVVTLNLAEVLSGGSFTAQGRFAATYNIYVAALVPSGRLGLASATWFVYPATLSWAELGSPISAYMEDIAADATNTVEINLLQNMDVTGFVGSEIYVGYGTSDTEMLEAHRYRGVYKVE